MSTVELDIIDTSHVSTMHYSKKDGSRQFWNYWLDFFLCNNFNFFFFFRVTLSYWSWRGYRHNSKKQIDLSQRLVPIFHDSGNRGWNSSQQFGHSHGCRTFVNWFCLFYDIPVLTLRSLQTIIYVNEFWLASCWSYWSYSVRFTHLGRHRNISVYGCGKTYH